jgi:cytochrome c oxidase subunit 2
MKFPIFPPQASTIARQVDALCLMLLAVCGAVLLGILIAILYFLFKYRRAKPANRSLFRGSTLPYEHAWTLIPLLMFMGMFCWGAVIYHDEQIIPKSEIELNAVGKQWMWKIQHPNGRREIDEMHVPVGQVVKVTLASQDVIHSFYLPAFRIKQDVVPGRLTTEWFQATKTGTYHLFCAEYCGKDHSRMRGRVIVMEPAEYEQWLNSGSHEPSLAQAGKQLFRSLGCTGCHMGSSVVRAPRLEGLYGKPTPLQDGRVVVADEAYIRDSILLPGRDIAAGYQPVMPTYQAQINEEQIFELIAYIKSLSTHKPESPR